MTPPSSRTPIRIWDLPTRLFHWLLVLLVAGMFITASLGGLWMDWHIRLGQLVCGLLLFRLVWGLVGGRWSRFAALQLHPCSLMQQASVHRDEADAPGHTPSGSWSILLMLLLLLAQAVSGLFSTDDIAFAGPLASLVSEERSQWFTRVHLWGQNLILVFIALHVLAVLYQSLIRHKPLIRPMLDGNKTLPANTPPSQDTATRRLLALVLLCLCIGLVWWLAALSSSSF